MSRRTRPRRAVQPPAPAPAVPQSPKIVSNPIFRCEAGPSREPSGCNPPPDQLRCVYRPGSLYALVHDPAAAASGGSGSGNGIGKPLPPPPCRAHRAGAPAGTGPRAPASRSGPVIVAGGAHGSSRVQRRRAPHEHDPFLAAYVACRKSAGGGKDAGGSDRPQKKRTHGKKKTKTKTKKATKKKRGKEGVCRGIWAAGAKYAGAMSCRYYGCAAVADQEQQRGDDAPAAAAKAKSSEAEDDAAPAGLTLDLSWAPAVLSARALERRREQRQR